MQRLASRQSGFTLVEIAIVLVIVGLLLGGVLKGQELIENARVKEAANMSNAVAAAYTAYMDRYGRMPGDDGPLATLTGRGGNWTGYNGGAGNANGTLDIPAGETFYDYNLENRAFWNQLRAANLLKGDRNATGVNALPRNSWGGLVGVTNPTTPTVLGYVSATKLICFGNVPGKSARALDQLLDDGVSNAGTVRATLGANNANPGAAAAAYNEGQIYTVCREF